MESNLDNMETTSDKSMVKVVMTSEALRNSEPYRFLSVEQALYLEAQGECSIVRKTDGYELTTDGKVMVEHLEKALILSYGPYGSYLREAAEKGEETGKWRIVRKGQKPSYGNQVSESAESLQGLSTSDIFSPNIYETKNVKKKRVSWVKDDFIRGGAELSSELVREVGRDCGYQIDVISQKMEPGVIGNILSHSDFMVISNMWGFSQEQLKAVLKSIYSDRKPYVKYEHDHRELSRPDFAARLFGNSRLNVFLSPVHLKNHRETVGADGICLPLAIDVDHFHPIERVERRKGTALVCNVRNFKSWVNLQDYIVLHPEIEFTVITAEGLVVSGENVRVRLPVSYEEMPRLYSEFEFLVHLLDGWGAGERVVFEARLCGCKVIANDKVGHTSWNKQESMGWMVDFDNEEGLRNWLRQAPFEFWKVVDRTVS